MSAQIMTPTEFSKDIQRMLKRVEARTGGNTSVTNTLIPEMRTIGKMLKTKHGKSMRQHRSPSGKPWEKLYSAPGPRVGDVAGMILDGRSVWAEIESSKQKKNAKAYRKEYGPPLRPMNALKRGGKEKFGVKPTKTLYDLLFTNVNTKQKGGGKRVFYYGPSWLSYGFRKSTAWVEDLQFGRAAKGKGNRKYTGKLPPREIVGLTGGMKRFMEAQIVKGFMRLLRKDKV